MPFNICQDFKTLSHLIPVKQFVVDLVKTFPPNGNGMVTMVNICKALKHLRKCQVVLKVLSVY